MENTAFIQQLPCWQGGVTLTPLGGGITNVNYVVEDDAGKYVVRLGRDILEHGVMRFNELAASRAAADIGLSPPVVHAQEGALVLGFIEGTTLTPEAVADADMLSRMVPLIKRCHHELPSQLRGPALMFWVFHVLRDYVHTLVAANSPWCEQLPELMHQAATLEQAVGNIEVVYGHNDLLAANWIDDGDRLWLIDWDYAGFNSPLFDLGGLASNNELSESLEQTALALYFGSDVSDQLYHRYSAMKCASLLRETLWSMVSECHSDIDFDYAAYTAENLSRYHSAWRAFQSQQGTKP